MNLDILNMFPGYKRPITLLIGVVLFAWHEASTAGYISDVPTYAYSLLALFGYNALAQGTKNDMAAAK
jgi:hypothetical protein